MLVAGMNRSKCHNTVTLLLRATAPGQALLSPAFRHQLKQTWTGYPRSYLCINCRRYVTWNGRQGPMFPLGNLATDAYSRLAGQRYPPFVVPECSHDSASGHT